ncbi:MAG: 50S ribosomal protein L4 [Acholeplasmataceae bacterium]
MKVQVLNQQGLKVSDLVLNDYVFGIEPHQGAIYEVVKAQRNAMRQGTHDVKGRSEVRGGGRKPYRQKGTGRARQGSIRAAQWVGGGVVFGPTPRSYRVKVNQKVRNLALRSALSAHAQANTLVVVDKFEFANPKTKDFTAMLEALKVDKKSLVVDTAICENTILSSRNIPTTQVGVANHVSVYDLLNAQQVVLTIEAVKYFEEALKQ